MRTLAVIILIAMLITSCSNSEKKQDATGIFEATEVSVSAEQAGKLVSLNIEEGDSVVQGQRVGLIDTLQLYLKKEQLLADSKVFDAQRPDVAKQIASLREQITKAQQEVNRSKELVADGAAPRKMLEDNQSILKVLKGQLAALESSLSVQQNTLSARKLTDDSQIKQIQDQISKCRIVSPISGIVLEKYMEQGELAMTGKPLFKVADMKHVFLRAYVTSAQLEKIRVGQKVKVRSDYGDGKGRRYEGKVVWISNKSEFTPKTILTDDERAELVYAIKIAIVNDGFVKIGMYGELFL